MPSRNPRIWLTVSEEEREELFQLWKELRTVGRRRQPEYIGQQLKFNPWLAQLLRERATQIRQGLAQGEPAPTSGTVEKMTKTPKTSQKPQAAKTRQPSKAAKTPVEEKRPIGRPPTGRKSISRSVTLKEETWAWLDEIGGGAGQKKAAEILEAARQQARSRR